MIDSDIDVNNQAESSSSIKLDWLNGQAESSQAHQALSSSIKLVKLIKLSLIELDELDTPVHKKKKNNYDLLYVGY